MQFKYSWAALACAAVLGLSGCGGGGDSDTPGIPVASPASLVVTDSVVGTGATAVPGKKLTVNYSGWLYSATAADHKGDAFETGSLSFTLGQDNMIAGWTQGLPGMKAGGKRTLQIPASLAYGSRGYGKIPPNAGLVFDVELTKVE